MQQDEYLTLRFDGNEERPGKPARAPENRNQYQPEDSAHDNDSLDEG